MSRKATESTQILDATAYNNPIDNNHEFYTDFSGLRQHFSVNTLYKQLNIQRDNNCEPLDVPRKLFLRGHRGTGKTSELLSLKNKIKDTQCYFVVYSDLSNGKLDPQNIEIVDILILLLEDMIKELENEGAEVSSKILEPFYDWYSERIREVNKKTDSSIQIEAMAEAGVSIPFFSKLLASVTSKLSSTNETKDTIRKVFKPKINDFLIKFNEFILSINEEFKKKEHYYDMLFMVDGFEKIGRLEDRKRIIVDDSEQFNKIKTNMLITLPIELHEYEHVLNSFANVVSFPLIEVSNDSKDRLREFVLKRIDESLFEDGSCIDAIIEYGAGSPRETLRVIQEAYTLSESDRIDFDSINRAVANMARSYSMYLEEGEINTLKKINNGEFVPFSKEVANLLNEKVLLDYGDSNYKINPIILKDARIEKFLSQ
jgi:hypothetical protein